MSVKVCDRSHGKFETLVSAIELAAHTIKCCDNENIFPKRHRHSINANLITDSLQLVKTLNKANNCDLYKEFIRLLKDFFKKHGLNGYILKCDIHDYFGSTSHEVAKLKTKYVKDEWARNHLYNIIDSFNEGENPNVGMGLGSEITQSVQLAVLHPMDIGITKVLGHNYYIRYMDDFYVFSPSKEELRKCLNYIREYMRRNGLSLNEKKTTIQKISQPIHFLGFSYLLKRNGRVSMRVLSAKLKKNKRKLRKMVSVIKLSKEECDNSLNCILAHIRKSNNRSQICRMIHYYNNLWKERKLCLN